MIIREWRARARPSLAQVYREHFRAKVIPVLSQVAGFRGAYLSQRRQGEYVEFLVLTRWESMHAIRAFAGADVEKAVVEPAAEAALASFGAHVRHYRCWRMSLPRESQDRKALKRRRRIPGSGAAGGSTEVHVRRGSCTPRRPR